MKALTKWPWTARAGVAVAVAVALVAISAASLAFALNDEFGGAAFSKPYAPYTAGPVVSEDMRPYAPYTAGPVVSEDERVPDRIGNYLRY